VSFRSTLSDIFNERTNFDFIGPRRRWFALSGVVILIGLISLFTRGLTFGIDFEGGTAWQVKKAEGRPSSGAVRDVLRPLGLADAKILVLGGDSVRVSSERVDQAKQEEVRGALAEYAGARPATVSITDVGPTWGGEVSRKAVRALIFFFLAIALYLSWRFEPKMALAAIAAVVHDIFVTVGVYSLSGFEVAPATVIAFLTILGFSLYDTVVVFDKVDENVSGLATAGKETYSDVVNRSMNEVLMRSLNTSFVAILPVFSLLVVGAYAFGALTIRDFALALFIGLITGAYSSIFTATPLLALMKEREPRYAALRQRLARTAAGGPAPAFAGVSATAAAGSEATEAAPATSGAPRRSAPGRPAPRPRQKRRRR
jgi:preprotein translocase subunit SecF